MKKIFTFIILICICFIPNMVEAKPKYEFQWDNDNEFYLYHENDKFYFTDDEFDFGRVEEYDLNIYDKNGEFLKSEIFFDPSKMTRKELFKTKRYQALSRYDELWEQREYFFDDEVYVYSISYVYKEITAYNLDEDKVEDITFEDGTDLLKELMGNKYGTSNPVPFRVVDGNIGLDMDISIRCFGEYSYRVTNPILFYTNVCGNVETAYRREMIDAQLKSELMTALQPAFAKISSMGIRYSALPGHTAEIADALNEVLSAKWKELRGIEILSFAVSSVKASEED